MTLIFEGIKWNVMFLVKKLKDKVLQNLIYRKSHKINEFYMNLLQEDYAEKQEMVKRKKNITLLFK